MEPKGICLCKQEMNVEDSFKTIVTDGPDGLGASGAPSSPSSLGGLLTGS